jgi:uncharacterized protein (UPF0335 family)
MSGIGHNSGAAGAGAPTDVGGVAGGKLKAFFERIERLEEEKAGIAEDIKDVYAEAKGEGFDVKILRRLIALRKRDVQERREEAELLELYAASIGFMLS